MLDLEWLGILNSVVSVWSFIGFRRSYWVHV